MVIPFGWDTSRSFASRLVGAADVVWAEQNGGDSRNVLVRLDEWAISLQPAVIHVNAGLHDLKRDRRTGAFQVPLDEYAANVERILGALQGQTEAKVLWAATTPVNERRHQAQKPFDRYESDVVAYNQKALEVCTRLGVAVDDLYATVMAAGADRCLLPDGVHFDEAGYRLLGRHVAAFIQEALG